MYKGCPVRLNYKIYHNYKKQIQLFQDYSSLLLSKRNKNFFFWIFNVSYIYRMSFTRIKSPQKKDQVFRFTRRTAPSLNLRLYSLYAAILKHGNAIRAKNIITNVIILLTENCPEKSGCKVLNNVLRFMEPAIGILKYRRGAVFYKMPVPLWPQRKKFLAAKFLVKGAMRRRKLYSIPFMVALYYEIMDVHARKVDCFTLKILKNYRKKILKIESEAWRTKKKQY